MKPYTTAERDMIKGLILMSLVREEYQTMIDSNRFDDFLTYLFVDWQDICHPIVSHFTSVFMLMIKHCNMNFHSTTSCLYVRGKSLFMNSL